MKVTLLIILLTLSVNCFSQTSPDFKLVTGSSIGLEIDDSLKFQQLSGSFSIQPQMTFGVIDVSLVALTLIKDTIPNFYVGSEIGGRVWQSPDQRTALGLTARYLYGSGGKQLLGGGLTYDIDRTTARFTADYNIREKTTIALIGVSYDIIK